MWAKYNQTRIRNSFSISMSKRIPLIIAFLCCLLHAHAKFLIEGKLMIDSTWAPVVYLSAIPSFDQMQTVSNEMIILRAEVNAQGYFSLKGDFLPVEDQLYRLHLSKKGDPPSTIIIGGKDENHLFLILNNYSCFSLKDTGSASLWAGITVSGSDVNTRLREIDQMFTDFENQAARDFFIGREFMNIALQEKLRYYADSSSHCLLALYALHHTNVEAHSQEEANFYTSFIEKWQHQETPYLDELGQRAVLPTKSSSPLFLYILVGVLGLGLGMGIRPLINVLNNAQKEGDKSRLFNQLSVQERKIFSFIREGKSNKEIAAELHIEPTTVKSHIRNIYAKLEISTRKEVLNFPDAVI